MEGVSGDFLNHSFDIVATVNPVEDAWVEEYKNGIRHGRGTVYKKS